jgi:hypothetical protein
LQEVIIVDEITDEAEEELIGQPAALVVIDVVDIVGLEESVGVFADEVVLIVSDAIVADLMKGTVLDEKLQLVTLSELIGIDELIGELEVPLILIPTDVEFDGTATDETADEVVLPVTDPIVAD